MEVEVKVLIADEHWQKLKKRIPDNVDDKKREVWFFETPTTSLKQQEIVLRARVNRKKKQAEATTKWRRWVSPYVPVREAWERLPGFKAEMDASLVESVPAWSITEGELDEELFRDVVSKEKQAIKFFNKHQRLLVESAWPQLPWDELHVRGPIESVKWELPGEIAMERWTIAAESVIELSQRGSNHEAVLTALRQWLRVDGIEAEALEGGKTAWALAHLSGSDG